MSPRIKAFLIHLALSLGILAVLLVIIYKIWYPQPFFSGDGGWQGVRIVAGVDIILGPLLTLVVFNIKKPWKELRRDLSIIGLIQITALCAGVWLVYEQRTRLITFADGYFMSLSEYNVEKANPAPELLKQIMAQKPPIAFVELPDDPDKAMAMLDEHVMRKPMHLMGQFYELLSSENRQKMLASGHDLKLVAETLPDKKAVIEAFLNKHPDPQLALLMIPINLRYKTLSLVLDKNNGEMIGTLPISQKDLSPLFEKRHQTTQ